jgi:hypothetical protein
MIYRLNMYAYFPKFPAHSGHRIPPCKCSNLIQCHYHFYHKARKSTKRTKLIPQIAQKPTSLRIAIAIQRMGTIQAFPDPREAEERGEECPSKLRK